MKKKIKILNILTGIWDGGMETLVYNIYNGLNKNKYTIHLVSLVNSGNYPLRKKLENIGCKITYFNFKNKQIGFKDIIINILQYLKLCYFLLINRYDVINSHDFFSGTVSRLAYILSLSYLFKKAKVIVTLHNIFFWLKPKHHKINYILSFITTNIVCVSKSVMLYSLQKDKVKENKYIVIYNGISGEKFDPLLFNKNEVKKEFNISNDELIIGNIGTLSIRKGQIYLINAFSNFNKNFPKSKLMIFGSPAKHEFEQEKLLKNFVELNNLNGKVIFFNAVDNVQRIYSLFDIFVMPSVSEGFSLASLEAMLMKKICIYSDIEPFKELIINNVNGFLFRQKDSNDLEEKLKYVAENLSELDHISENARRTVIEKFSYNNMIINYDTVYSK